MNDSSHQGALLGRYAGPVREVFAGDPQQCAQYIPLGRKLLGYLKNTLGAGGVEVGTKRILLANGDRITVHVDGTQHILHIDVRESVGKRTNEIALFVETGWIPLSNLSGGEAPLTFSPLYYGTKQYAALAQDFPQWLDEIILRLDEHQKVISQRAGLVRIPHPPTLPNYPPESFIDSIGFQTFERYDGEGRPDFVYTRTPAGQTPNPGYATGKLKLYLQSLLGGIEDKNFVLDDPEKVDPRSQHVTEIVTGIMGSYWAHINPGIAFNWDFSRGLFTSDDYQYWIITIQDRSVFAQKIRFLTQHQIFRRAYLKILRDPETPYAERTKIESYLLSGGIRFGAQFVVAENLLADFEGSPLHEGWKFNYRGTDAQIVTKEVNWEVNEGNGITTIVNHTFRRYHLHIQYNAENTDAPFSATIEKLEEVDGTPEEKCLRPYRDPLSAGHVLEWEDWHEWLLGPARGYLYGYIEYDVPLYCWYTVDNQGNESFVTVRDIVKWPDEELSVAEIDSAFSDYLSINGPVIVCGGNKSVRVENVIFPDKVNAKRGYYLRIESGECNNIHEDLLSPSLDYTYAKELVDGRVDTVVYSTVSWRANADFGGYLNLGFPSGTINCEGVPASLPPGFAGGLWVDITSEYGTWESFTKHRTSSVRFGHVLVFPYNDGSSVYIQRNTLLDTGYVYVGYAYSPLSFTWDGTAVFADGHEVRHVHETRLYMASPVLHSPPSGMTSEYVPQYCDLRFAMEYPAGHIYYNYSGYWSEISDNRKLYYASDKGSDLVFDETATKISQQSYSNFPFAYGGDPNAHWVFPPAGIDTGYCFGKHEWYVIIDMLEFFPWFDNLVALNSSTGGDIFYLQQWGPFVDRVQMPFEPTYNATDPNYPIFLSTDGLMPNAGIRQFDSIFVGWA